MYGGMEHKSVTRGWEMSKCRIFPFSGESLEVEGIWYDKKAWGFECYDISWESHVM